MEPGQQESGKNIQQLQNENTELFAQLTNKNEQYMLKLNRALKEAEFPEAQRTEIFNEMLPKLVDGQRTGQTARQLYGTVTERTAELMGDPEKQEEKVEPSKDWKLYLDGSLLMGGMFAFITGLGGIIGNSEDNSMGIFALLINFIVGGLVILYYSKNLPNRNQNSEDPKKKSFLRYLLVSLGAMLLWIAIMTLSVMVIPASVNVPLPPVVLLIIGIAAFAAKWYLKRKLNIRGSVF